jgi:hypothetical protein
MSEDLLIAVFLLVPRCGVSFDRSSHVRLFLCIPTGTLIGNFDLVESPSGIGTELPWQLRCPHGPPRLHSLSAVSQSHPHTIYSKDLKIMAFSYSHRTCERAIHSPRFLYP